MVLPIGRAVGTAQNEHVMGQIHKISPLRGSTNARTALRARSAALRAAVSPNPTPFSGVFFRPPPAAFILFLSADTPPPPLPLTWDQDFRFLKNK